MMGKLVVLVLVLVAALALPAAAYAQSDAFNPLPPAQQTQTAAPAPTAQTQSDPGDIGRGTLFIIGGGLLALFVGIGWAITRDARETLPEDKRTRGTGLREEGPHKKGREAKSRARAKGRAARQARKQTKRAR